MRPTIRRTWQVGAVLASTALIAACGSSGSSTSSNSSPGTTSPSSSSAAGNSGVAAAQALINKYLGDPAFTAPGPALAASKVKGKSLFSIPASSSVAFDNTVDQNMKAYAKDLGIRYIDYPNQQEQSQWVQGMNEAVADKANVVDLLAGIPPDSLAPQIKSAKAAGVATIDTNERDATQPTEPYVAAYAFAPFKLGGELMGAWAVTQTKGKANVLIVTSNADTSSAAVQAGVQQEMASACSSCHISTVNVNPVDWATQLQTTVEGTLSANPSINYVLPVFDSMSSFIAPAIVAAGKSGSVHIASFNGTPSILDTIRTGDIVTMDVGENTDDVAAAGLDQAMRVMLGMKPGNEIINVRVIDKSNVDQTGVPSQSGEGYGDAFLQGYAKLWGVSPGTLGG